MSVDSFAKIDMSLDDIIKLQRKEKKKAIVAGKKINKTPNKLNAAQQRRAELLKTKARNMKMKKLRGGQQKGAKSQIGRPTSGLQTGRPVATSKLRMDLVNKRTNILRKNKVAATKGGRVTAARKRQMDAQATTSRAQRQGNRGQQNRRRQPRPQNSSLQSDTGYQTVKQRLGKRVGARQWEQRQERQQTVNQNRRGRGVVQGTRGRRGAGGNRKLLVNVDNESRRNTSNTRGRNRQYNQQPRQRQSNQQSRVVGSGRRGVNRRGNSNATQRQQQSRNTSNYSFAKNTLFRSSNGGSARGRGKGNKGFNNSGRSVTLY